MSNFLTNAIHKMKEVQKAAIEEVAKQKAITANLEQEIRERAQALKLMDSALNPEKANMTLREVMA